MNYIKYLLLISSVIFTLSINSAESIDYKQSKYCTKITNNDKAKCNANNGEMMPTGKLQCYQCIITFKDAGKQCNNATQCEGSCLTKKNVTIGSTNNIGYCQKNNNSFGCNQEIDKNGIAQGVLCID